MRYQPSCTQADSRRVDKNRKDW